MVSKVTLPLPFKDKLKSFADDSVLPCATTNRLAGELFGITKMASKMLPGVPVTVLFSVTLLMVTVSVGELTFELTLNPSPIDVPSTAVSALSVVVIVPPPTEKLLA